MAASMMSSRLLRASGVRPATGRRFVVPVVATSTTPEKAVTSETVSDSTPGTARDYAKTLPGISEPFPNMFDPANFLEGASIREVRRWRESEIVHGRVSMLAALGFIVQEQLEDFPAFLNFDGHITGPAIYQFQQVEARGAVFWEPLLLAIGLCESYRVALGWDTPTGTGFNSLKPDYDLGNLNFDPLGLLKDKTEAEVSELKTKELNNGRLAMIAIAAFVAQELVENKEIFEHWAVDIEKEAVEELEVVEREVGSLP